eukprot:3154984-Prymnesium_polylepis.1
MRPSCSCAPLSCPFEGRRRTPRPHGQHRPCSCVPLSCPVMCLPRCPALALVFSLVSCSAIPPGRWPSRSDRSPPSGGARLGRRPST